MQLAELLASAATISTEPLAHPFSRKFIKLFAENQHLKHLYGANDSTEMEGPHVFIQFDLLYLLNQSYGLSARPEIREGEFAVVIRIDKFLDNAGISSQNWETLSDYEVELKPDPEQTIDAICESIALQMVEFHRELIASVGVPEDIAITTARDAWLQKAGASSI